MYIHVYVFKAVKTCLEDVSINRILTSSVPAVHCQRRHS